MPKFYIIIARKIFCPEFLGGTCPCPPVSYAYCLSGNPVNPTQCSMCCEWTMCHRLRRELALDIRDVGRGGDRSARNGKSWKDWRAANSSTWKLRPSSSDTLWRAASGQWKVGTRWVSNIDWSLQILNMHRPSVVVLLSVNTEYAGPLNAWPKNKQRLENGGLKLIGCYVYFWLSLWILVLHFFGHPFFWSSIFIPAFSGFPLLWPHVCYLSKGIVLFRVLVLIPFWHSLFLPINTCTYYCMAWCCIG